MQRRCDQRRNYDQSRPPFKFDSDFDFEKANAEFRTNLKDLEDKTAGVMIQDNECEDARDGSPKPSSDGEDDSKPENGPPKSCYNKNKSFFDTISVGKNEGNQSRPNWKRERTTNQETFGLSAIRSNQYRGFRGGGQGYQGRGGYQGQSRNFR